MEIGVPVVKYLFGQVFGADQLGEILSREGEVATIDLAQQVLTADGHVLRVVRAQVIVALVGTGAAFDARIEKHR